MNIKWLTRTYSRTLLGCVMAVIVHHTIAYTLVRSYKQCYWSLE